MDMKARSAEPSFIGSSSADARLILTRSLDRLLRAALSIFSEGSIAMTRVAWNRSVSGWVKGPVLHPMSKMTHGAGASCAAIAASGIVGGSNCGLVVVHKAGSLSLLGLCRERRDRRQSQGVLTPFPAPIGTRSPTCRTSKDNHAARDGARGHQPEAFVDIVELVSAADEAVEVDALVHVKIGEHAEVDRGPDRPVIRA
jgi:hypothetical protein